MSAPSLDSIRRALDARDPDLAASVVALAAAPIPGPEKPSREGALTYEALAAEVRSEVFLKKPAEERSALLQARFAALEAENAEVPLPGRLRLHEILLELWNDDSLYARTQLLDVIARVPLCWGPWRALKQIFKESMANGDVEVFGALAARFDTALANREPLGEIRTATVRYLVRRAWRHLRRIAVHLGASYPDAAVAVLARYPDDVNLQRTWIANHVFFHETGSYNSGSFTYGRVPSTMLKHRYKAELWRRTPRPLFVLLEQARSERARRFAVDSLKSDFRTVLREVEPSWVARLVDARSAIADAFVVWLLNNVPRFEQNAFRDLGLHEPVLALLDSPADNARAYAAAYARAHARDLPLRELLRLANNSHKDVRDLARDLLFERDPRKDVGLDAWGRLLGTAHAHDFAADAIRRHFGAGELTPDWFHERLLETAQETKVFKFIAELLDKVHTPKKLGAAFYQRLLDSPRVASRPADLALKGLYGFPLTEMDVAFLRRLAVHPLTWQRTAAWIDEGRLPAGRLGTAFLKALAFHPDWESSEDVKALRSSTGAGDEERPWARDLEFNEKLSQSALAWLGDVRLFTPDELGFDWLMRLVERAEPEYHEFGVEYMIKAFLPADFSPEDVASTEEGKDDGAEVTVDLGGASFLFTGKLATMTRGEAKKKVTNAGGKNASGVNKSLDYLVVGDEGSPLYGEGRKGSKQIGAEKLIDEGASLRVISETAFLQMLTGQQREASADAVAAGCERLWQMATEESREDTPLGRFARRYLRRHHPAIAVELTDRHVDPGTEIPEEFLTFERVEPLFNDPRKPIRDLALEFAKHEFARWQPDMKAIVRLAESSHVEVRDFVALALTADDSKEHRKYRVDPERLTPDVVYRFCESLDGAARALGMRLIARDARLAVPEELFRLTESPDRMVRAFVVRTLWSLYRDQGVTVQRKPRPEKSPAGSEALSSFLRRMLFTVPPGRPPRTRGDTPRMPRLPARKAKLGLIEVLRDLAVEDTELAGVVHPVLREFMGSRGKSEHDACLVALTRIERSHPVLAG